MTLLITTLQITIKFLRTIVNSYLEKKLQYNNLSFDNFQTKMENKLLWALESGKFKLAQILIQRLSMVQFLEVCITQVYDLK